jgi:hypothetical protein|tara:strand:- start:366 stop:491 length:126 start_codon:yes stop_codon:yes gene_type:complete
MLLTLLAVAELTFLTAADNIFLLAIAALQPYRCIQTRQLSA